MLVNSLAKIMDFGIAKMRGSQSVLNQGDSITGTHYYMAPERISAKEMDNQSDIFSLGVTAYEWFTGKKPFRGGNLPDLMKAITEKNPDSMNNVKNEIPEQLDRIIKKMLAKMKHERYFFANQVADDLKLFLSKLEMNQEPSISLQSDRSSVIQLLQKITFSFPTWTTRRCWNCSK